MAWLLYNKQGLNSLLKIENDFIEQNTCSKSIKQQNTSITLFFFLSQFFLAFHLTFSNSLVAYEKPLDGSHITPGFNIAHYITHINLIKLLFILLFLIERYEYLQCPTAWRRRFRTECVAWRVRWQHCDIWCRRLRGYLQVPFSPYPYENLIMSAGYIWFGTEISRGT